VITAVNYGVAARGRACSLSSNTIDHCAILA
jgi:hypothetical protein